MISETIVIDIVDGQAVVTSKGFTGAACLKATADIEKALGHKTSDTPTAEMRTTAATVKTGAGQ